MTVRLTELRQLIYKADKLGDNDIADMMQTCYNRRKRPDINVPDISYEEALRILDDLAKLRARCRFFFLQRALP